MKLTIRNYLNFNNFSNGDVFDLIDNMFDKRFSNEISNIEYATNKDASLSFNIDRNKVEAMIELIKKWGFYNSKYEFKYISDNAASQDYSGHNVLTKIDGFNIIIHIDCRNIFKCN